MIESCLAFILFGFGIIEGDTMAFVASGLFAIAANINLIYHKKG